MSCADTRAAHVSETMSDERRRRRAAPRGLHRTTCVDVDRRPDRRPGSVLVTGRHPLVHEPLEALSLVRLGRVEVALRVDRDAVHAVELPGLPAAVAERRQLLQRLAIDDAHFLVHAVGHEDVLLLRVLRERDVPHRAGVLRVLLVERFLDELALGREDLEPVADAVADVQQAIDRHVGAVHRVAELLRGRRGRIVRAAAACRPACCRTRPSTASSCRCRHRAPRRACSGSRRRCTPRSPSGRRRSSRRGRSSSGSLLPPTKPATSPFAGCRPPRPALRRAPFLPICSRNLPSLVNFRMCESGPPLPPIQTLPL